MKPLLLPPLAFAVALGATPLAAAEFQSVYTDVDLEECTLLETYELGASFACPGYRGFPFYVEEGDLRFFLSYGFGAPDEMAARQTLPNFNYVGDTLEWRLTNESGDWKPFATIIRYFIDRSGEDLPDGQILVVTKIEPGNTCHIAYIDTQILATSDANPNQIARDWADAFAADFNCGKDEPHLYPS
jgi:hypothetical protein